MVLVLAYTNCVEPIEYIVRHDNVSAMCASYIHIPPKKPGCVRAFGSFVRVGNLLL